MKKWLSAVPVVLGLCLILFPAAAHATEMDYAAMAAKAEAEANKNLYNPVAVLPVVAQPVLPVAEQPVAEQPVVSADTTTAPALSTYVDVNTVTQTMVYYENGEPVLMSPIVTGSPGRSTPKGVFMIDNMVPGKYLTGPTWHVWVDRWMRFSGNCGLHDASWRKEFGGDIYLHNGSHGCVNLPKNIAVALYDRVGIGTVVIVH